MSFEGYLIQAVAELAEGVKRRERRAAPGRDRQDFAHEAANHGEQARNQHDAEQDEIEKRYRHRLVWSAGKSKKFRIGAFRTVHPEGHFRCPARPEIALSRARVV